MVLVGRNGESAPKRVRAEILNDRIVEELVTGKVLRKELVGESLRTRICSDTSRFFLILLYCKAGL